MKIFKNIHTLISSLPHCWPWMHNDPWFIMTEENTFPLRAEETCSDNLSCLGWPEPPETDMCNTYQLINSSCSSSRKPTMNQGEESCFGPHRPHFTISVKAGAAPTSPSHPTRSTKQLGTQSTLITEKVFSRAHENRTNWIIPAQNFLKNSCLMLEPIQQLNYVPVPKLVPTSQAQRPEYFIQMFLNMVQMPATKVIANFPFQEHEVSFLVF